jgi:hypothetical protein
MEKMSQQVFGGILGDKSFSHKDLDFTRVDRWDDLIGIFIEFEKDTVLFYETLIPFIEDNDTLENIAKIIAEENNHIKKLHEFLVDKTKSYNNLSLNFSYITNVFNNFTVVFFSIDNLIGFNNVYGYNYSTDGAIREAVLPTSKRSVFLGMFISLGEQSPY